MTVATTTFFSIWPEKSFDKWASSLPKHYTESPKPACIFCKTEGTGYLCRAHTCDTFVKEAGINTWHGDN